MIATTIGPSTGVFPDIAADPLGWVMPWQDQATGELVLSQLHPDGEQRVPDVPIAAGGGLAFPRVWVDPANKHTWLAWRHEQIGGIVLDLTGGTQKFLGFVYGNCPVAIGGGRIWYQADAVYGLRWRALDALDLEHVAGWAGRPTGLAHVTAAGEPVLVDDVRLAVPGMVNPQRAGRCTVGENGDAGPDRNIARLDDGREASLWPGMASRTPRIATDQHAFAVVTSGGPGVRAMFLTDPPDFRPVVVAPPPPPVSPDIPWKADPTRTVDMLDFVKAAASAYVELANGHGELWLHKSQERPDWGENWDHDRDYIGFREDRSTGTRMVSMDRPKVDGHTNTRRNRLSPEEILERNARGENLGDPLTLPLAGYTWRGNRVWMPRHVQGRASISQHTDYVWWDLPEHGGVWEVWANLPLTMVVETGYARFNGHEVFARSRYGKPAGDEWNYWGPHGWIAFRAYDKHGVEEPGTASTKPAGGGASPLNAPFVAARFPPTYPIFDPAREQPDQEPEPMPNTYTEAEVVRILTAPLGHVEVNGARKRFVEEVLLDRDKLPQAVLAKAADGSDLWPGDVMTGGAATIFDLAMNRGARLALLRGVDMPHAVAAGFDEATRDYRRAVGIETGGSGGGNGGEAAAPSRRVGFSRIEGTWWADDAGFYTPLDLSMLYAGSDGVDPRPLMDQAAALGFDGARIFGGRLTPSDARTGQAPEAMPARIGSLAGELQARGLELQVPMLTDTGVRYDEDRHVDDLTQAAKECPNLRLLQILNEIGHGSQRTFTTGAIKRLASIVTGRGWSRALDAGAALWHDEIMPAPEWPDALLDGADRRSGRIYPPAEIGNVACTHYNRGRWPFYANVAHGANELRILAATYDKARSSSEPGRTDHPDVGGQHVAYGYALGISATGFGIRTVIHSSQARDARTALSGVELDAARAAIRGHRALPRGRYEFFNANNTGAWPASPIKSAAFVDGPSSNNSKTVWRAWSFRHAETGQWFLVLLGPAVDQPGLQFQHGFSLDAQIDRVDNLIHVWTLKQG